MHRHFRHSLSAIFYFLDLLSCAVLMIDLHYSSQVLKYSPLNTKSGHHGPQRSPLAYLTWTWPWSSHPKTQREGGLPQTSSLSPGGWLWALTHYHDLHHMGPLPLGTTYHHHHLTPGRGSGPRLGPIQTSGTGATSPVLHPTDNFQSSALTPMAPPHSRTAYDRPHSTMGYNRPEPQQSRPHSRFVLRSYIQNNQSYFNSILVSTILKNKK